MEAREMDAKEIKVMRLPCVLSDSERMDAALLLGSLMQRGDELEDQMKSMKRQIDADIASNDAAISKAREMMVSGKEYREVECVIDRDWTMNQKLVTRTDTGELVSVEPIPEHERQQKLKVNLAETSP